MFDGYHKLPLEEMYQFLDLDYCTSIVPDTLTRQRYKEIKRNLHLSDNANLNIDDKLFKVRPYMDLLNKKFLQFGLFKFNLLIDEQMIPYKTRHSAKNVYSRKACKIWLQGMDVSVFQLLCVRI